MDEKFWQEIMKIHSKLDTIIAKAVTSEKCSSNMKDCRKEQDTKFDKIEKQLKPLEFFHAKLIGGIIVVVFVANKLL